jgi:hypothetical protein
MVSGTERQFLFNMITAGKAGIKRVLMTEFPEIEAIRDIQTRVMLHFLQGFPSIRAAHTLQNGLPVISVCYEPGNKLSSAHITEVTLFASGYLSMPVYCI